MCSFGEQQPWTYFSLGLCGCFSQSCCLLFGSLRFVHSRAGKRDSRADTLRSGVSRCWCERKFTAAHLHATQDVIRRVSRLFVLCRRLAARTCIHPEPRGDEEGEWRETHRVARLGGRRRSADKGAETRLRTTQTTGWQYNSHNDSRRVRARGAVGRLVELGLDELHVEDQGALSEQHTF